MKMKVYFQQEGSSVEPSEGRRKKKKNIIITITIFVKTLLRKS